jgi:hypothetical protein
VYDLSDLLAVAGLGLIAGIAIVVIFNLLR